MARRLTLFPPSDGTDQWLKNFESQYPIPKDQKVGDVKEGLDVDDDDLPDGVGDLIDDAKGAEVPRKVDACLKNWKGTDECKLGPKDWKCKDYVEFSDDENLKAGYWVFKLLDNVLQKLKRFSEKLDDLLPPDPQVYYIEDVPEDGIGIARIVEDFAINESDEDDTAKVMKGMNIAFQVGSFFVPPARAVVSVSGTSRVSSPISVFPSAWQ